VATGGFGSAVIEALQQASIPCPVEVMGWPDQYIEHGSSVEILRQSAGLDTGTILERALEACRAQGILPAAKSDIVSS